MYNCLCRSVPGLNYPIEIDPRNEPFQLQGFTETAFSKDIFQLE